ncbi:hypothetical protein [Desulfovulcanus sp.]
MSLKEINLKPLYDTSSSDLIRDFFIPVLSVSKKYDRGVGFFSAAWLRIASKGMVQFAQNGGYARWVTSPILSKDDWEALLIGYKAREDEFLRSIIEKNIDELEQSLEKETLSALSWMIADKIIDFKLAVPRNKLDQGEFHDKFGMFYDSEGNFISFNGSYNDSIQGTRNYESIKVFTSWDNHSVQLAKFDIERFDKLWHDKDPNVKVYDLPKAVLVQRELEFSSV